MLCATVAQVTQGKFFLHREVAALLRPSIMKRKSSPTTPIPFSPEMLRNYFKIGSRVLLKNSSYSLIHLTGLSIGLWACMMVATVVIDSLSYDRQWSHANDIYRIVSVNKMGADLVERSNSSPANLAPELQKMYAEVENWSSIENQEKHFKIHPEDRDGVETRMLTADTMISQMLDFKLLAGSLEHSTQNRWSLLVTRSYAAKMFPGQNPVGRIIHEIPTFSSEPSPYEITGLIEDLPYNSHLRTDVIRLKHTKIEPMVSNGMIMFGLNYLMLKPGTDIGAFTKKVNAWYARFTKAGERQFEFQPLRDVYLHSDFAEGQKVKTNARTIYIFCGRGATAVIHCLRQFCKSEHRQGICEAERSRCTKNTEWVAVAVDMQLLTETLLFFGISVGIAVLSYYFSHTTR
jgi:putative ABC transport system permease protein